MIPLQDNIKKSVSVLAGEDLEDVINAPCCNVFSKEAIDFLDCYAAEGFKLCRNSEYREFSLFFFWLRKQHLNKLAQEYPSNLYGKGLCFHIAPANVPVNTLYTLAFGMLAGCPSIVRISSRVYEQIKPFLDILSDILSRGKPQSFSILSYSASDLVNSYLSSIATSRIIWGGDKTVQYFHGLTTSPNCIDIKFADKSGVCIVDLSLLQELSSKEIQQYCSLLANDIGLYSQRACSSPLGILFVNSSRERQYLKTLLFTYISDTLGAEHSSTVTPRSHFVSSVQTVLQLSGEPNILFNSEYFTVVEVDPEFFPKYTNECRPSDSLVFSYDAEMAEIQLPANLQTVVLIPFAQSFVERFMECHPPSAYNRVVKPGQAINMHLTWDGFDIIRILSKSIEVSR